MKFYIFRIIITSDNVITNHSYHRFERKQAEVIYYVIRMNFYPINATEKNITAIISKSASLQSALY
jgi:hypothetical protein